MKPRNLSFKNIDFKELSREDPFVGNSLSLSVLIIVAALLFVGIFWTNLPKELPLFYSKPWGEDQLVEKLWIFLPSAIAVLFLFVNSIAIFYTQNSFLKKMLAAGTLVVSTLSSITTIRIVLLVT